MKVLSKINHYIHNLSAVILGLMTSIVLIQVFFRYVVNSPLTGSEELARFAMIWLVLLGATIAVKNNSHIKVTLFVEKLPQPLYRIANLFGQFLILGFSLILLVQGFELAMKSMAQLSPATQIPAGYIALAVPISGLLSTLYTIENIYKIIMNVESSVDTDESGVKLH